MRVGKATVVLAMMCWLAAAALVAAQESSGFEDLLSDIGTAPAAEPTPVPASEEPAAEPAEEPADVLAVPVEEMAAEPEPELPVEPEPAAAAEDLFMPEAGVEAEPSVVEDVVTVEAAVVEAPATAEEPAAEDVFAVPVAAEAEPAAVEAVPMESFEAAVEAETGIPEAEEEPVAMPSGPEPEPAAAAAEEAPAEPVLSKQQAKQMAAQEEVRRQAMEIEGLKRLEAGYRALSDGDFPGAIKHFEVALANLPERPANAEARNRASWGKAEAHYRIAADIVRRGGNLADARQNAQLALTLVPDHRPATDLLKRIAKIEWVQQQPVPPAKRPDVIQKQKTVAEMVSEGKQYMELRDYNRAEALFDKVLIEDEYNVEAMRYLRKIDETRFKLRTTERDATTADMMAKVRQTWNPPTREEVELPATVLAGGVVQAKTGAQRLQEKMARIMIPSIEFRAANITDVINFLVEASIAGDPEATGVNIILNLGVPGESSSAPAPAPSPVTGGGGDFGDLFGEPMGMPEAAPATGGAGVRTITLNLRRISLLDAIKYITEVAGLKFRVEDNAVIITPAGVVSGRVITRLYPVQPSILDVIVEKEAETTGARTGEFVEMGGGRTTIKRGDVKDFFERTGVPFPAGTSITYNQTISQLIVANTPENLEIFERILAQMNVIPNQVEIEARFVEIGQNDLEELGLQWMLTDNYEFLQKNTGGPISTRERFQVNADNQGFTKGLRFFSFDGTTGAVDPASSVTRGTGSNMGGILTVASILTNPEMTMVLQALSQHGNADLLSAPRITTKTGVNAQIQVVREIIYPTEFEVTQPTVQSQGDLVTPPTVTPGSFETREIGVILNVTPTVGPDGYTIDLTLVPEVAELVDWIQYGSEFTLESAGTVAARGSSRTFRYNIPQPVFSSRNATTSIIIWDGQTVVMGGLIREELTTVKDKIPFLGDIPLLGRLFRTEGQKSRKTNLLIFVTARLVDPAGKPIHRAEAMAMPGQGAAGGEVGRP